MVHFGRPAPLSPPPLTIDPTQLLLALARALPLSWVLPFGARDIPRGVGLAVTLAIASVLCGASLPLSGLPEGRGLWAAVLCELGIGAVFALACAVPFYAVQWTGQFAQTVVLLRAGAEHRPLTMLFRLAALNTFFLLGGHRALCAALVATLDDAPLGSALWRTQVLATTLTQLVVDALALCVTLALPLLMTLWIVDAGVGLIARTMGHGAFVVSRSPLRAASALLVLGLTFTPVIDAFPLAVREGMVAARSVVRNLTR